MRVDWIVFVQRYVWAASGYM